MMMTAAITTIRPIGMGVFLPSALGIMYLKMLRNQPPTDARAGQEMDAPSQATELRPRVMSMVHRVAMKAGRFMMATNTPLSAPKARPRTRATIMPTQTGQPKSLTSMPAIMA